MEFTKKDIQLALARPKKQLNDLIIPIIVFPVMIVVLFIVLQNVSPLDMRIAVPLFGGIGVIFTLTSISIYFKKRKVVKDYESVLVSYMDLVKSTSIPERVYALDASSSFGVPYYVWFTTTNISFFPLMPTFENYKNQPSIRLSEIQFNKIKYYYTSGDKYYENKISGGGSTGPNIAGAIIGEQIAGIGGAFAMGQSKTNPIESKLIVHDERRTVIAYKEDSGLINKCLLPFDFYDILYDAIPDLSRDVVENPSRKVQVLSKQDQEITSDQIEAKLKKLLDLKNRGIIDDQDYQEQKSKLLNKM